LPANEPDKSLLISCRSSQPLAARSEFVTLDLHFGSGSGGSDDLTPDHELHANMPIEQDWPVDCNLKILSG
jgi:hypothetical protein